MCLITYLPPGVMPAREHLENGAKLNPHGFGFAIGWSPFHSMDREEAVGEFMARRAMRPDLPAMFHSRNATGDSLHTLENCHPFPVFLDNSRLAAVAHNGYLFPHEGDSSDTAVFARDILPRYDLDDPAQKALLEARMGPNKAVVLRGRKAHLLNAWQGEFLPDGTWHSNTDYLGVSHEVPGRCLYADRPSFACGNDGEISLGDKLICASCDEKARERHGLLMEAVS